jgi:hypothetical protein
MPAATKDTIYIDVDEDITSVIDKVVSSKHKIVAVVLPKHAAVFQSTVNVKLLKKAATKAKKNLVLITSDKTVLAIAAASSLHVAKSLASKPEIPKLAVVAVTESSDDAVPVDVNDDSAIELDNTAEEATATTAEATGKKSKIMKIPDFSRFSVKLTMGVIAVVLLVTAWVFGFVIMPRATITITTDTATIPVASLITARIGQEAVDVEEGIVPAKRAQVEKIDRVTVNATGQKNVGEKATGIVTVTNCINDGEKKIIPAGTQFSSGNLSFLTTEAITLNAAYFNDGECRSADLPPSFGVYGDVSVEAANPGPEYNIASGSLTSSISGIRAFGSSMSGGSSRIVTVISAEDVQEAEEQLRGASRSQALNELREQLRTQGVEPLDVTLGEGTPRVTAEPAVDAEAPEVTVTMTITYNLTGVASSDLEQILTAELQESLTDEQKNIRDTGLSALKFELSSRPNEADTVLAIETIAVVGPEFNEQALRENAAGQKRGDIEKSIQAIDGVRAVSVEYSPVWITTTPKSAEKIEIVFIEQND